jgi:hypothetical protein
MISWHLIQGCTFGIELVDGNVIDSSNTDWFIVVDLFIVRAIVNF